MCGKDVQNTTLTATADADADTATVELAVAASAPASLLGTARLILLSAVLFYGTLSQTASEVQLVQRLAGHESQPAENLIARQLKEFVLKQFHHHLEDFRCNGHFNASFMTRKASTEHHPESLLPHDFQKRSHCACFCGDRKVN